jgi:hypothetical protein
MDCEDFHKIKHATLQLASVGLSHIHPFNDSSDFTVISNKQIQGWTNFSNCDKSDHAVKHVYNSLAVPYWAWSIAQ